MIVDNGSRREFGTGAVRDINEGKGRCDLLPLDVISECMGDDPVLDNIYNFIWEHHPKYLQNAVKYFADKRGWDNSTMVLEVSIHFAEGAEKYAERNWEKGIDMHCYIDSGLRHYFKYLRGDNDERHDRAFVWNMWCCIWTMYHHPELCDLPKGK